MQSQREIGNLLERERERERERGNLPERDIGHREGRGLYGGEISEREREEGLRWRENEISFPSNRFSSNKKKKVNPRQLLCDCCEK